MQTYQAAGREGGGGFGRPTESPMTRLVLLIPAVLLAGCSSTHTVRDGLDRAAANRALGASRVTLHLADRGAVEAQAVHLDADTTSWIDPATGRLERAATVEVLGVERRSRTRGAIRGATRAALGAAVTTAVATLFVDLGECRPGASFQLWCNGDKPLVNLAFGAGAGLYAAVPGALVGGGVGARDTWSLEAPPADSLSGR